MKPSLYLAEPEDFSEKALQKLSDHFEVHFAKTPTPSPSQLLHQFDVIWFRLGLRWDSAILKSISQSRCRIFVTPVTSPDHIDETETKRLGISVLSLRGEVDFLRSIRATAEHTLSLALTLLRKTNAAINDVRMGKWDRDSFRGTEISGKTVGIVGVGRLGLQVAELFKAFGAKVLGFDQDSTSFASFIERRALLPLLGEADLVSLHLSLNDSTRNFFGSNEFAAMKQRSYFINTSRSQIVDESALLKALQEGRLAGAALDVLSGEPQISASHPLVRYAQNNHHLLITPHIGGNTYESFEKTELFMAQKLIEHRPVAS